MGRSWLPLKDQDLRAFCAAFLATITPAAPSFGLAAGDVTALTSAVGSYTDALAAIDEPSTRTRVTVAAKQMSRHSLMTLMRNLYKKVRAANLTNDKLEALGLPVPVIPSPVPVPAMSPQITIVSRHENTVSIKFTDPTDPTRRGRPPGVDGISVFSFVGETPPTTSAGWHFEGSTSRMSADVVFPSTVAPGSKVWLTAFFFNPRALSGPAGSPISTYLPGGAAMAA
jgi:hypothetical protein